MRRCLSRRRRDVAKVETGIAVALKQARMPLLRCATVVADMSTQVFSAVIDTSALAHVFRPFPAPFFA